MAPSFKKAEFKRKVTLECPNCLTREEKLEHSAYKELRTASELVVSLREAKHALKTALKSALGKNDELYSRFVACAHSLKDETKRRKAAEEELTRARTEAVLVNKRLSHSQAEFDSLEQELQRVKSLREKPDNFERTAELEASVHSLRRELESLREQLENQLQFSERTQLKITKYCSFISTKLNELPDYLELFKGRFPGNFTAPIDEESVLKLLQFIADLLIFEAENPLLDRKVCERELENGFYSEDTLTQPLKSPSKSVQTPSEKGTNTYEAVQDKPYTALSIPSGEALRTPSLGRDCEFTDVNTRNYDAPKASTDAFNRPNLYVRRMADHRSFSDESGLNDTSGLIEVLSFQSEKLSKLNLQIAETMASSRTLLNTSRTQGNGRYVTAYSTRLSSPKAFGVDSGIGVKKSNFLDEESLLTERKPKVPELVFTNTIETKSDNEPHSPPSVQSPYFKAPDLSKPTKALPEAADSPEITRKTRRDTHLSPNESQRTRIRSPPVPRVANLRPKASVQKPADKVERPLKTMPVLYKKDGWSSVSEFFGLCEDDEKAKGT